MNRYPPDIDIWMRPINPYQLNKEFDSTFYKLKQTNKEMDLKKKVSVGMVPIFNLIRNKIPVHWAKFRKLLHFKIANQNEDYLFGLFNNIIWRRSMW